jgi:SAM-dependent methyltransferase
MKPNFVRKNKRRRRGAAFWDREYAHPEYLSLSDAPSEEIKKFTHWLARGEFAYWLKSGQSAMDLGCGNGRHLIFLAKAFDLRGIGYDSSTAAIARAKKLSLDLPIVYEARNIALPLPLPDASVALALDAMTSHFLSAPERLGLRDEVHRVLSPGGFLFMRTFLKDGDLHTARLLKENPAPEPGSYLHPIIGVAEHVYAEEELLAFLKERFIIHKVYRSHKHAFRGRAQRRRAITIYAQKDPYR